MGTIRTCTTPHAAKQIAATPKATRRFSRLLRSRSSNIFEEAHDKVKAPTSAFSSANKAYRGMSCGAVTIPVASTPVNAARNATPAKARDVVCSSSDGVEEPKAVDIFFVFSRAPDILVFLTRAAKRSRRDETCVPARGREEWREGGRQRGGVGNFGGLYHQCRTTM